MAPSFASQAALALPSTANCSKSVSCCISFFERCALTCSISRSTGWPAGPGPPASLETRNGLPCGLAPNSKNWGFFQSLGRLFGVKKNGVLTRRKSFFKKNQLIDQKCMLFHTWFYLRNCYSPRENCTLQKMHRFSQTWAPRVWTVFSTLCGTFKNMGQGPIFGFSGSKNGLPGTFEDHGPCFVLCL